MDEPLPPDPWITLGVQRSASENEVKSAYRKLALKCHPDKFPDEAVKKVKEEEFHNIKQAYDIVLDPAKVSEYEASCKLAEMRKEAMARGARGAGLQRSHTDIPAGSFKTRTAAPSFAQAPPTREEPAPRRSYDERYDKYYDNRASSRKYDDYASQKRSTPKTEEKTAKVYTERKRTEGKKDKDRSEKRERSSKYPTPEYSSESDEKPYRGRRGSEDLYDKYYDNIKAAREHIVGKGEDDRDYRRSKTDERDRYSSDPAHRKLSEKIDHASTYIRPSREDDRERERPSVSRNASASVRYDSKSRPSFHVRRSSARPKDRERDRERDRIVEAPEEPRDRRPPPSMPHATSSPAALKIPQDSPRRSQTYASYSRQDTSPPSTLNRSTTAPMAEPMSSRKRDGYHSKIKEEDSGYSSPGTPEAPYAQASYSSRPQATPIATASPHTSSKYNVHREYDIGHGSSNPRIVERTPGGSDRRYTESPEPIRRPTEDDIRYVQKGPGGSYSSANIPTVSPNTTRKVYSYSEKPSRPTMPHAASHSSARPVEDRGRLYGEIPSEPRRPGPERRTSYRPEEISTTKRYGMEDVKFKNEEYRSAYKDAYEDAKRDAYEEFKRDAYEEVKRELAGQSSRSQKPRYDRVVPGLHRHPTMA